jgi:branched-chain amino acid aminotransferase
MDPAFLYGESLVTTVGVCNGQPEFIERHVSRILQMAKSLEWSFIPSRESILRGVRLMIKRLVPAPRLLRITITPGALREVSMVQHPFVQGDWFIFPVFRNDPLKTDYERGVDVAVTTGPLLLSGDPRGRLKTGNLLLSATLARKRPPGVFEWILKGKTGRLLEGSVSNVFFIRDDGSVLTAPERWGVLPGVIRSVVLEELKKAGRIIRWSSPKIPDLGETRGVFLTNSYLKVMPVGRILDEKGGVLWEAHPACLEGEIHLLREKLEIRSRSE